MNSKNRKSRAARFLTALLCLVMLSGFALPFSAASRFVLGEYFTDHAVLQRDMPVRLTGTASPGKTVTAKLFLEKDGSLVAEASATAASDYSFTVVLPPQAGSYDTYKIEITNGETTLSRTDLLFGEVWLTAGQSNRTMATASVGRATRCR